MWFKSIFIQTHDSLTKVDECKNLCHPYLKGKQPIKQFNLKLFPIERTQIIYFPFLSLVEPNMSTTLTFVKEKFNLFHWCQSHYYQHLMHFINELLRIFSTLEKRNCRGLILVNSYSRCHRTHIRIQENQELPIGLSQHFKSSPKLHIIHLLDQRITWNLRSLRRSFLFHILIHIPPNTCFSRGDSTNY